jgi:DNA-binding GntR family transcriptional regulator
MPGIAVYEKIRDALRVEIEREEPGARFASETVLAERFSVTRATVRQALDGLIQEGRIVRQQGRGTFVSNTPAAIRELSRLSSFTEDIRRQGLQARTRILTQEEIDAPPEVADALLLDGPRRVIHLLRVRSIHGMPATIQEAWVPAGSCPSLAWDHLEDGSLYATLERRCGIRLRWAEQHVTAVAATRQQSALLGVPQRSPLLRVRRITHDATGKIVELALSWTRPEYELTAVLKR